MFKNGLKGTQKSIYINGRKIIHSLYYGYEPSLLVENEQDLHVGTDLVG